MQVEINQKFIKANDTLKAGSSLLAITPPLDEDYWIFRVPLYKDQSLVAFPKFFTIGIGFAQEDDWNTNLPFSVEAEKLYEHIEHNRKYEEITKEQIIEAIKLLKPHCEAYKNNQNA